MCPRIQNQTPNEIDQNAAPYITVTESWCENYTMKHELGYFIGAECTAVSVVLEFGIFTAAAKAVKATHLSALTPHPS